MSDPKTVYLAGAINSCTDAEAHGWRDALTESLNSRAPLTKVLNPMDRDYRGIESENVSSIVESDMLDVQRSDLIACVMQRPSVGTSMEILYAYQLEIPVLVFWDSKEIPSPWLVYHATTFTDKDEWEESVITNLSN